LLPGISGRREVCGAADEGQVRVQVAARRQGERRALLLKRHHQVRDGLADLGPWGSLLG